jgi:LPS export ABC transporter protein LptC
VRLADRREARGMIGRLLILLVALSVLVVLLYVQNSQNTGPASTRTQDTASQPGFVALDAHIIQTGDDGQPVYTLDASQISQPVPQGLIYLTSPVLHYTPAGGNPWVLTAEHGQLPQGGHMADLSGMVKASGKPQGSAQLLHFSTALLHVNMQTDIASTPAVVHSDWAGSLLSGRGMRADLKSGELQLFNEVSGVVRH